MTLSQSSNRGVASGSTLHFTLGKDSATKELVRASLDTLMTGLYIIGRTGSGKTTLLINLILQAIDQGLGLCFLSPHSDAIDDVLAHLPSLRMSDVVLVDLSSDALPGLNLFSCNNQDDYQVSVTTQIVIELFAKLWTDSGDLAKDAPTMHETVLAVSILLIYNQGYTLADVPLLLGNKDAALRLVNNLPSSQSAIRQWWEHYFTLKETEKEHIVGSFKRRLLAFLVDATARRIFGQSKTTLDFTQVMNSGKIMLVKLDRQRPALSSLVGATLVAQIAMSAYSRSALPEASRQPFMLFADEYQRFSTPTFAELLSEVRKFRIATCVAHQFRDQLDYGNKGATLNAGNMAVFAVSGIDGEELAKSFRLTQTDEATQNGVLSANILQTLLSDGHPSLTGYIQRHLRALQQARNEDGTMVTDRTQTVRGDRYELPPLTRFSVPRQSVTLLYSYDQDMLKQQMTAFNDFVYNAVRFAADARVDIPQGILHVFAYVLGFGNVYTFSVKPNPYLDNTALLAKNTKTEIFQASIAMDIWKKLQLQREKQPTLYTPWLFGVDGLTDTIDKKDLAFTTFYQEMARMEEFITDTHNAIAILRKEPLYVSSPARYGLSSPGTRLYADMEKEIAKQLVSPPAPYAARVKLAHGYEGTIIAHPLPPSSHSAASIASRLLQNTTYLTPRSTVEQAITDRQRGLQPSSFLPTLSSPLSLAPAQPFSQPGIYAIEEEFEPGMVVESVPTYSKEEELYRQRYYAINGCFPSYLPMSETQQQKRIRLFIAMNGFPPPASLVSKWGLSQTKSDSGAVHPATPPKSAKPKSPGTQNTPAKSQSPKQPERKKRSKQEEE